MPVKVSEFVKERRELTVETPYGDIELVYRPNLRTPADEARMAASQGEEVYKEILTSFETLVVKWDVIGPVLDNKGKELVAPDVTVPIEKEILQFVNTSLITAVFSAMLEDMRPNGRKSSSTNSQGLFSMGSRKTEK